MLVGRRGRDAVASAADESQRRRMLTTSMMMLQTGRATGRKDGE